MTLPLGTGFPDFARQESEAQVLEINDLGVNRPNGFAYGGKYVGNAKAIQVWANPSSAGMRVNLNFFGDDPPSIIMDTYQVNILPGDVFKGPVPILGPWLDVQIFNNGGVTQNLSLQVWRTPVEGRFAGLDPDLNLWAVDNAPISAGATITSDCPFAMEGPAVWSVAVGGATYTAKVLAVDYQGVATLLDFMNGAGQFLIPRPVYLPPSHIRCTVRNDSASAQTFTLTGTRRHNI